MNLNSVVVGEGEPLILIHGLFGSLENLGGLARCLQGDFRIYSLDLPNHGRSGHRDNCGLEQMAAAVLAWMDEQGLERAALVGHSLGGKVAMEIALRYPQRVSALIVMDIAPVVYELHHQVIFTALEALTLSEFKTRADIDAALAHSVAEASVRSFLLKNLERSESGAYQWRMNLAALKKSYPNLVGENHNHNQYVRSTLFLKAANSDYIRKEHQPAIVSRFPRAEFKIVADTGHWLHAEKPALVGSLIKKFLHNAEK